MARTRYTPEQREEALAIYVEHGPAVAAERLGIPQGTIASWATRAGVQSLATETLSAAVEAKKLKWADRRLTIADDLGDAVSVFVQAAREAATKGDGRNAQALATAAAISIDKAQLVTGQATSRTAHDVTDPEARLALVRDLKSKTAEGQAS